MTLANSYLFLGDPTRAESYARRAVDLDPLDSRAVTNLALALLWQRRYAEACEVASRQFGLSAPRLHEAEAHRGLVLASAAEGRLDEARRWAEGLEAKDSGSPRSRALRAFVAAAEGRHDAARTLVRDLEPAADSDTLSVIARVHVLRGDRDAAFAALER